jgi:hypothetical protein
MELENVGTTFVHDGKFLTFFLVRWWDKDGKMHINAFDENQVEFSAFPWPNGTIHYGNDQIFIS